MSANRTLSIAQATGSVSGFLSSTDWTTFNNKQNALGFTPANSAITISTTSPLSGGGDLSANRTLSIADASADGATKGAASFAASDFNSTSGNISIDYTNGQSASGSVKGFLTSTDWTTFNNKQNALTNPITGTGTSGQVAYFSGTTTLTGSNDLFFDGSSAELGIGTATPNNLLQVNAGSGGSAYAQFTRSGSGGTGGGSGDGLIIGVSNSNEGIIDFQENADLRFYVNGTENMRIENNGGITILEDVVINPIQTDASAANMYIDGIGLVKKSTASSARYKTNISDWQGSGLSTIKALKPRIFNYKSDYYSQPNRDFLGLIAEEVQKISPLLVDYKLDDPTKEVENVRYANIVVPLIKAIQEQQAMIEAQAKAIEELKKAVEELKNK